MASSSSSWTPLPGRHKVNIGSSLSRALKARKGSAPTKRNNLPDRDFHSVRYPFKPTSIDSTKPGSLDVKRGSDGSNVVTLEHPTTQPGEAWAFPGNESSAKDWACVLIYDEESGTYTLEKVESFIALEHPERRRSTSRPSPYPPSTTSNTPSINATRQNSADADDDLENAILDSFKEDGDSDGEEDIPLAVTRKKALPPTLVTASSRPTKPLPSRSRTQSQTHPHPQSHSQPVTKPMPPPKVLKVPPIPPTSQSKSKKTAKRATPTFSDAEEEVISFGKPSQPNRPGPSPPASASAPTPASGLELPGTSYTSTYSFPQATPTPVKASKPSATSTTSYSLNAPNSHGKLSLPTTTSAPVAAAVEDSDEDEDWDEVVAPDDGNAGAVGTGVGVDSGDEVEMDDAGEEIDMDLFGTMIEEQLGEEDNDNNHDHQEMDFLAQGLTAGSPEPEPPRPTGAPMSLRQFVGGGDSDDDESSSEESDDD
ncbi:hypothetical protein D9758_010139 [Tetrapyrgos nigripes]|uniref:Transcription elongation factor Eaf N-terminal domain-containing protein n=1 Tax=Tetrapyrgos nigripes TaxID=182062 RepID=A0A8H5CRZ7_9AGAR|nr:hypothetical protein D9758_010139 [Tetrapyrgos nigripes]